MLTKTYSPAHQYHLNPFMIKLRRKRRWSLSKIVFWTSKQPFSINFFSTTCNVCPEEILEIFAQTYESDSAPCHHFRCGWRLSTARWWSYSGNLSKSAANLSSTAKGVFLSAIACSRLHFFSSSCSHDLVWFQMLGLLFLVGRNVPFECSVWVWFCSLFCSRLVVDILFTVVYNKWNFRAC